MENKTFVVVTSFTIEAENREKAGLKAIKILKLFDAEGKYGLDIDDILVEDGE